MVVAVNGAAAKLLCALGAMVLSVFTMINTYGLTIQNWHWLVWGGIGQLVLLGAASTGKDS